MTMMILSISQISTFVWIYYLFIYLYLFFIDQITKFCFPKVRLLKGCVNYNNTWILMYCEFETNI